MQEDHLSVDPDATAPVAAQFERLIKAKSLIRDPAQAEAISDLDRICQAFQDQFRPTALTARLWRRSPLSIRGAYLWGDVGRGKSLLMDVFFKAAPLVEKRRFHFHEFMDEIHEAIRAHRATRPRNRNHDPVAAAVGAVVGDTRLLCLDEFQVRDITNAMLLHRLYAQLVKKGVTLVATSNVEPDHLYENGLNRQLFLPFVALLKDHVTILKLAGARDHRRARLADVALFHVGIGTEVRKRMNALWSTICGNVPAHPATLISLGRQIDIPAESMGAARFSFAQLCEAPLGARDYLRLAHRFHTIMIDNVPAMARTSADAARRFIELIDTLYDNGVKLAASFSVPINDLAEASAAGADFARCTSRLSEMQSDAYLSMPHFDGRAGRDPVAD